MELDRATAYRDMRRDLALRQIDHSHDVLVSERYKSPKPIRQKANLNRCLANWNARGFNPCRCFDERNAAIFDIGDQQKLLVRAKAHAVRIFACRDACDHLASRQIDHADGVFTGIGDKSDRTVPQRHNMCRMFAHRDEGTGRLAQVNRVEHGKKPCLAMTFHACAMPLFAMFGLHPRTNHQERTARPEYIHIVRRKRQRHGVDFAGRQIYPTDRIRGLIGGKDKAGCLSKREACGAQPDKARSGEPEQSGGVETCS